MSIINKCPHPITLIGKNRLTGIEARATLASCRPIPRVLSRHDVIETVECHGLEVMVQRQQLLRISNLPMPREGVFYVVSRSVAVLCKDRPDIVSVNEIVTDNHRVIGARSLVSYTGAVS